MNTHEDDLFKHVVKYFAACSLAREQPADLTYEKFLGKAKIDETAVANHHHNKETY